MDDEKRKGIDLQKKAIRDPKVRTELEGLIFLNSPLIAQFKGVQKEVNSWLEADELPDSTLGMLINMIEKNMIHLAAIRVELSTLVGLIFEPGWKKKIDIHTVFVTSEMTLGEAEVAKNKLLELLEGNARAIPDYLRKKREEEDSKERIKAQELAQQNQLKEKFEYLVNRLVAEFNRPASSSMEFLKNNEETFDLISNPVYSNLLRHSNPQTKGLLYRLEFISVVWIHIEIKIKAEVKKLQFYNSLEEDERPEFRKWFFGKKWIRSYKYNRTFEYDRITLEIESLGNRGEVIGTKSHEFDLSEIIKMTSEKDSIIVIKTKRGELDFCIDLAEFLPANFNIFNSNHPKHH